MALAGTFVFVNIFHGPMPTNSTWRRRLCVSGSLTSMLSLRTSRFLTSCEIDTVLNGGSFDSVFGEPAPSPYVPGSYGNYTVANTTNTTYVADETQNITLPGGEDNVAFVVTVPSCPEDATVNSSNTDPGDNFYDAAAVLKNSVCNCTSENPDSGSNYSNTMYAVIHPDAIECLAPVSGDTTGGAPEEGRRLQVAPSRDYYDRIAVLEELGYYVIIYKEPVSEGDAFTKIHNTKDLMSLYAYNLTNHPVSVMVNFDTVFTSPIDDIVVELTSNTTTKKAKFSRSKDGKVNPGIVFLKPDSEEFNKVLDIVKNIPYDETTGWNGTGVTGNDLESLLTFHFDQDTEAYEDSTEALADSVVNFGSNKDCGEPWDCKFEEEWDAVTQQECTELNQVWYRQRKSFEGRWSKNERVDTTQSSYHADAFMGYCAENGEYQRASDFSVGKQYAFPASGETILLSDYNSKLNSLSLPMTKGAGQLGILSLQTETKTIPVARSYDAQTWEASSGFLASRLTPPTCDDVSGLCTFATNGLPPPEVGESYAFSYYEHDGFGDAADAARFLEQTTFGGSLADITSLVNTGLDYGAWLTEQMSSSIMTSHREYYRRRLNKESEYSSHHFNPGPFNACDPNSQWRAYALSERDGIASHQSDVSKYLSIREMNGPGTGAPYLWLVEGMVRTVTNDMPKLIDGPSGFVIQDLELEPVYYEIEFGVGNSYKWNCIGCPVRVLTHNADGSHGLKAYVANPKVDLTNFEALASYSIVNLPSTGLSSINNGDEFRSNPIGGAENWFAQFNAAGEEFVMTQQITDACQDHPITASAAFTHLSQLNSTENPGVNADRHVKSAFPPIFGKVLNTLTQQEDYFLYSPKLYVPENTPENPLPDGGKMLRDLSAGASVDTEFAVTKCSNVPRNFLNEQYCRLANTEACSSTNSGEDGLGVVVCGSIGEVSNSGEESFGGRINAFDSVADSTNQFNRNMGTLNDPYISYKNTIWANIALSGQDQLRQRMAWALYQLIPIGADLTTADAQMAKYVEGWTQYYDIFVRNAFGNFKDILKQIAYNPAMARWLSFIDNKSLQYDLDNGGPGTYPDENFAREIMQLFSIGIYQLSTNGAIELDSQTNAPRMTYDTNDLMSFARVWTGFTTNEPRGNAHGNEETSVDPLSINPEYHDVFPKSNLEGGYLGDGYPLCADLPDRVHFRKGAIYRLLGSRSSPELQKEGSITTNAPLSLVLDSTSSPLYTQLCQADSQGVCTFPGYVTLGQNLDYSAVASTLPEYANVESFRIVQVQSSPIPIYYEYVRPPCVETHFFNNGKKAIAGINKKADAICANPTLPSVASPACCRTDIAADTTILGSQCVYYGERLSYQETVNRCSNAATSSAVCVDAQSISWETPYAAQDCSAPEDVTQKSSYSWTATDCQTKVKLSFPETESEVPQVSRVDYFDASITTGYSNSSSLVSSDSINFYKVHWMGATTSAPTTELACNNIPTCGSVVDGCICDVNIIDSALYYSSVAQIVSVESLLSSVFLGAVDADVYDAGVYTSLGNCGLDGVLDDVHVLSASSANCASLDVNTIFTVTDQFGVEHRRKNVQSTVEVISTSLAFRNPVHHISMLDRDERDIHYEVDALLEHIFYYKSHAPFLALRMIQRFGISNPSPGFIERVATAYKIGTHANFGSGEYGDLEALLASILLDPESRSVTLDADPSHGQIREPMLKLTGYIRSMDGRNKIPTNWAKLYKMDIGQDSYGTESVFSFFLPEYEPAGVIGDAGLVSPEAGVLSGSYISNLLEGLLALSKFGMTNCGKGIVSYYAYNGCSNKEGDYTKSEGQLEFVPSNMADIDTMLDEFSLLLTAGRLGSANRAIIKSVVFDVHQYGKYEKAARIAQQLITMTPEYHTTNLSRRESTKTRTLKDNERKYDENDYKAVVYWLFKGGVDSFNLIVPLDDCVDGKDMFLEYTNARKYVALKKDQLLNISSVGSSQVCDKFGVNGNFPILQELYNDNDALFIANSGVITQPINKHMDWAKTLPILFAHNHMQKEVQAVDPLKVKVGTGVGGRMMDMLKKNGFNTAANTVRGKALLNKGDSKYNNPSWNINTRSFQAFDPYSSVGEDMLDIIKELNGVAASDTSIYGETWSSNVNQMIYEIEQEETIFNALSSNNLDISNYGTAYSETANHLRAVAKTMKARHLRRVNRDIFYVHQRGFDDHFKDHLAPKLQVSNTALTQFVTWLKAENLWDNTVILMASEFGRTITPNPGGGTDHAWGGNYFMVGGGVKGGQIVGEYPTKLTHEYDYWTGRRGRMIPSTSNDAIWNGIATWMGVKGDEDLNFILPTRPNFPKCSLFTDEDLFDNFNVPKVSSCTIDDEDGDLVADDVDYCQGTQYWIEGLEVDGYGCALPTPSPPPNTPAPTISKVAHEVANVLDSNTHLKSLGATYVNSNKLLDGTTTRYQLTLADGWGPPGFIATPSHGQPSIVHGIRIYMSDRANQSPTSFELQGRNDRADGWTTIAAGTTNMSSQVNEQGHSINSTPYEPDMTKAHREILFSNIDSYMQYRVVFPTLWYSNVQYFSVAEIELVGRIIYNGWTPPPSQAPTTPFPTTHSPTTSPTTGVPSVSLVPSSMPSDRCAGVWAEGEEKVVLSNNYNSVSGLAWKSTVVPVIPGYDGTGQAAMMYYSAPYARQPAIRQGVSKTILNNCVRAGMRFQVTWRVKLLDGNDDTQGYPCTLKGSCPTARFRIRQEDSTGKILCNSWYGISRTETSWDVGGWNFKSETFTIPSQCTGNNWKWFFLDLHNGHNFAPFTTKMIVDDTKIVLLD